MLEEVVKFAVLAVPVAAAIILHEIAHGWVANRLGDPTAKLAGRLTLNPIPHIDPVGTLLLPFLLAQAGLPAFGWARPVPVVFGNLRRPRRDMVLVAAAGPATNFVLAALAAGITHLAVHQGSMLAAELAAYTVLTNIALATFNMIPIPPLDGGRVAVGLLPRDLAVLLARVEPFGLFIIFGLMYTGALNLLLRPMRMVILKLLALM